MVIYMEQSGQKDFFRKLSESYERACVTYFQTLEMAGATEFDMIMTEEAEKSWYEGTDSLLGMSPLAYIESFYGGKPDLEAAAALFRAFAANDVWEIPRSVVKLLSDFGEEGALRYAAMLQDTEAANSSYNEATDPEMMERQDILISAVNAAVFFPVPCVSEALWALIAACREDNENIIESVSAAIVMSFGAESVVPYLNGVHDISEKESCLMQCIVNSGEKSDSLYRCLRGCAKKSSGIERMIALSIFTDYGDPRAVSYLRTVAKELLEELRAGGGEETRNSFYEVASMVSHLGGNTDDLLGTK